MNSLFWAASVVAVVAPAAVQAEIVDVTISGTVTGHQMPNGNPGYESNPTALAAFVANYALGSSYRLTFSYDTAAAPVFSSATYAWYNGVPVGGMFMMGNAAAALPVAGLSVGYDSMSGRQRFALFGNAASPWTGPFAGFSPIDFSFEATATQPIGPALPTELSLAKSPANYARVRFIRNDVGETGVLFSIDSLVASRGAAVPEPASWAMMIVGFGVAGAALRRRGARSAIA